MDTLDKVIMFVGCIIEVYLVFDYFYNFFSIKMYGLLHQAFACFFLLLICLKMGF